MCSGPRSSLHVHAVGSGLSEEQKNKIIDKMKVKCETDSIKLIEAADA